MAGILTFVGRNHADVVVDRVMTVVVVRFGRVQEFRSSCPDHVDHVGSMDLRGEAEVVHRDDTLIFFIIFKIQFWRNFFIIFLDVPGDDVDFVSFADPIHRQVDGHHEDQVVVVHHEGPGVIEGLAGYDPTVHDPRGDRANPIHNTELIPIIFQQILYLTLWG